MKYLGLILVVVVALAAGQVLAGRINEKHIQLERFAAERSASSQFRAFLDNKARTILREGNATLGIPVMDPFESEKMGIELNEDFIKGSGEATNFWVIGASGYKIDKAEVSLLARRVRVGLTWPKFHSKGSYKLDAVVLNKTKAYGAGDYVVTATDLSFESTIWLKVSGGIAIKEMKTSISLGALRLAATGLLNGDADASKILSEAISDAVPQLIKDYQKEITTFINKNVMEQANAFLKGKSLNEILAILG